MRRNNQQFRCPVISGWVTHTCRVSRDSNLESHQQTSSSVNISKIDGHGSFHDSKLPYVSITQICFHSQINFMMFFGEKKKRNESKFLPTSILVILILFKGWQEKGRFINWWWEYILHNPIGQQCPLSMLETKGQISQSPKPFSKDSYLILLLLRPQTCLFPSRSWIFACAVSSLGNRVNFSTKLIADHPGAGVRAVFALDHKYALLISIFLLWLTLSPPSIITHYSLCSNLSSAVH